MSMIYRPREKCLQFLASVYCIALKFKENRNYSTRMNERNEPTCLLYIIIIDVITLKKTACYLPTNSYNNMIYETFELEYEISFLQGR